MTVKNEINDVSPNSLKNMIGQKGVVDQVAVAIAAAKADQKRMDHCLLVGPPGLGKSQLANVIAAEMGTNFREVLGQSVKTAADLNSLLLKAKERDVIHIDEAHLMPKEHQTALLMVMDKRKIVVSTGKSLISLPVEDITFLLSTTDQYLLLRPLSDRFKLQLHYDYYSSQDLEIIVKQRCESLEWKIETAIEREFLSDISRRSRGTPRLALRLLGSARRVSRSENKNVIRLKDLRRACELENIDEMGLGLVEQKYLQLLADGPLRLNVISSVIGLPSRTISEVTEPYLLRSGLVSKMEDGKRTITQKAIDHLNRSI